MFSVFADYYRAMNMLWIRLKYFIAEWYRHYILNDVAKMFFRYQFEYFDESDRKGQIH